MVQLSYSYMTTGKSIALTRRTFVGKVMFLLFNALSRLVAICLGWLLSIYYVILCGWYIPVSLYALNFLLIFGILSIIMWVFSFPRVCTFVIAESCLDNSLMTFPKCF